MKPRVVIDRQRSPFAHTSMRLLTLIDNDATGNRQRETQVPEISPRDQRQTP